MATSLRWGYALTTESTLSELRKFCFSLTQHLGTNLAIYLPDNGYCPARAFDLVVEHCAITEIIDFLSRECGPPAQDINTIVRLAKPSAPYRYEYDGAYYIDDFSNL